MGKNNYYHSSYPLLNLKGIIFYQCCEVLLQRKLM